MNEIVANYHKCRFIGRGKHFSFYRKLQLRCHLRIRFVVRPAAIPFLRMRVNYKKNSKYTFLQAITIVFPANSSSILLYFTLFRCPFIYPAVIHHQTFLIFYKHFLSIFLSHFLFSPQFIFHLWPIILRISTVYIFQPSTFLQQNPTIFIGFLIAPGGLPWQASFPSLLD